tara:strand:+ start:1599 stop:2807 length:1209 start_codon:yes stop_codon:yes gene_type:complete
MKVVIFFSLIIICFSSLLNAKEFLINASSKIFHEDKDHAKRQALKNALYDSVKQSVETLMDTKQINKHYGVIKNNILKFSKNFIRNYEIVNEEIIFNEKIFKILVKVNVNNDKIQNKLKVLRILKEKNKRKRILAVYQKNEESNAQNMNVAIQLLESVNQYFAEHSFWILNHDILNKIYMSLDEENIIERSLDSFIALALIFNTDILIIMGMNSFQEDEFNKSFYKVKSNINFSVYDTYTGQQITETSVTAFETSLNRPENFEVDNLLKKAGKHAVEESVRQVVSNIKNYYQNLGYLEQGYSAIFRNYNMEQENRIIDYFENDLAYSHISEIKNAFGYIELELFFKKRKSILRRKIISDLQKMEIEVATKSLAGNRLSFINPDSEDLKKRSDNSSNSSGKKK